jgi:predicted secreted hydrolase
MAITGTVTAPGSASPVRVTGSGYFEHAWGFLPALDAANWDLFALQLDDGRDLYLAQMRDRPTSQFTLDFGAISNQAGRVTTLHRADFSVTPTGYWQRDATCRYPVDYDLDVRGLHLHIHPVIQAQELRATRWPQLYAVGISSPPVYWDGEVTVTGDATGRGYLDMARFCFT